MRDAQVYRMTNGLACIAVTVDMHQRKRIRTKPDATGKVHTKTVYITSAMRYVSSTMPMDSLDPLWMRARLKLRWSTCTRFATRMVMPTALKLRPALAACIKTNQYDPIIKELAFACRVLDSPLACINTPQRQILAEEIVYTAKMLQQVGQFAGSDAAGGMTIEFDATKLAEVTAMP